MDLNEFLFNIPLQIPYLFFVFFYAPDH